MSAELEAGFTEAFLESREAFGVSIRFGATTVTALVAESTMSRELIAGGFQSEADFIARVLLADLSGTPPALGSPATYKSEAFKVSRVAIQPGHPIAEVTLRPAKR